MKKVIRTITFYDDGTYEDMSVYTSPMPSVPLNPQPYNPFPTMEPKQHCPKCGLKLEGVMGYVCPNNPCPTGMGGVWCSTTDCV